MNIIRKSALGLVLLLVATGCASQHQQVVHFPDPQKPIEDPGKGRIYVIRHPWLWNIASHTAVVIVMDGDEKIGSIAGHRGFLCWEREPGTAKISAIAPGFQPETLELSVERGKVYYLLQGLVPTGASMGARLKIVDEETGIKELSKCKPPKQT